MSNDDRTEGLNLQTADALINYDLPWNPMRVEQRIGRIDRIGQENPVVKIINYAYEDSVDGDIYEELENRLDLFEDVVGPMRPVLNSLEGDIKTAVMGNGSDGTSKTVTQQAEERAEAARAEAEKAGLEEEEDEEVTRESLIRDAGLVGGGDSHHPALTGIGERGRAYYPTVTLELMETLLTQSRKLESADWEFTALRNHERVEEYPGTARGAYVLEGPDQTDIEIPETATATAQAELRDEDEAVVTFDPAIAEEFPSIRLLLPGDPLFDTLVSMTTRSPGEEVVFVCGYSPSDDSGDVIVETEYHDTTEADIVVPAVREGRRANLPEGTSLPDIAEGKDVVRDWLAGD